jgi:anaerobic selenocysteine-containing dehydrogenase
LRDQGNPVIARHSFDQVRQYLGGEHGQDRMCDLLVRSGAYGDHFGENPEGLTLAKLKESPHGVDFGSMKSRMREVIHHVDGRIDFAPAVITRDVDRLEEWITSDQPAGLQLLGRRQVRSYNTWMHNFPVLAKGPELCLLMMNPDDAAERDIVDGQMVRIRSRTGAVQVRVELSDSLRRGVVSLPHGWGHDEEGVPGQVNAKRRPGVNFNHLADELLIDVPSGNTNLNCIPVEVESLPS